MNMFQSVNINQTLRRPTQAIAAGLRRAVTFRPLWVYAAAFIAIVSQLLIFRHLIFEINPWLTIKQLTVCGDVALLLIPFVLLRPRWRWSVWIAIAGMTVFCYVNLWYCRAFYDLMPFDSLGMGGNMEDRVIDAFFDQLRWPDWLLLLPPVLFGVVTWLARKDWRLIKFPTWSKIVVVVLSVGLYAGAYMVRAYRLHAVNPKLGSYAEMLVDYPKWSKVNAYKFTQHLTRMGYVWYMGWQLYNGLIDKSLSEKERNRIDTYWDGQRRLPRAAGDFAVNRGKNLIFIIVESLASDAVGMSVNGVEVAPTLNALASDSLSVVFRRMQPQVNHGRSSDGQFIYNTGLLPLRNNVVAKRYPSARYPSIAKALGYGQAIEVVGEKPTFYNHSITNISYGYTGFYPCQGGDWLHDDEIFGNALHEIRRLKQPFFATVISLDMHDPYNGEPSNPTEISNAKGYDRRDLNYLERVHRFDRFLGEFLDSLRRDGIYDKSVVVIASDHEPRRTALGDNLLSSDIFLMILNSGCGMKSDRVVGQIDVMPTVLDVMGVAGYEYPGLGHSLVAEPSHHGAVDAFGRRIDAGADSVRLDEAWLVSALMIEGGYFKK